MSQRSFSTFPGRDNSVRSYLSAVASVALLVASLAGCDREPPPPAWAGYELPQGSEIAPVLYPDEALATFRLPEGFQVELVAAEPLVMDPVRAEFDADGRLWVVEMPGYMPDLFDQGADAPTGRIAVLEDLDADGRMDRRTVFLDSLVLPRAIAVLERGVLVGAPPNLWFASDTTGDLRADVIELVRSDFGDPAGNVEHNANGFIWGIDNWLHAANYEGQFRLRADSFEFRRTPSAGQWGVSMDEYGRIYRNNNSNPIRTDIVSSHYGMRNPKLPSVRGSFFQLSPNLEVFPARPTPAVNRGYSNQIREDSTLASYTAAAGAFAYVGDALPAELREQVFIPEPSGNLVGRLAVRMGDDEVPYAIRVDEEGRDFMASTDERFRPVYMTNGPDGALYVVDMYRGIIQHRGFMTNYLEEKIVERGLETPTGLGRIYRIVPTSSRRSTEPVRLSERSPAELVGLLSHSNGWHRITAQRLLVERGDRSAAPALRQVVSGAGDDRARLHALWTLEGLNEADLATLQRALIDSSPHVRAAAVRISEPWLAEVGHPVTNAVLALLDETDPIVRRQLAASLGELPLDHREPAFVTLLERHGADPFLPDLVVSGLPGRELQFLDRLLDHQTAGREETLAPTVRLLATILLRSRDPSTVERLIAMSADEGRPLWQRVAMLPAFGRGGGGGTDVVQLARQPAGLAAMLESPEEALSAGARALDASLDWPGKPRPPQGVRPLRPTELARFEAGGQQYETHCSACHQSDGRGLEGLAKSLVESERVLGPPIPLSRVVLHGFDGEMLMPPWGEALSDEDIAAVLTYVRRSWGNGADPVSPQTVFEARGSAAGRDRPWTDEDIEMRN